jgi:hypothetical protein
MVNGIHDAGLEVILDVAYNHTGESDGNGPTISFRGIDNLAYYRTLFDDPAHYINDTGTGNTINVDHPQVRRMIIDSLRYWSTEMGVDGFRFDLATILGRHAEGFSPLHPLLHAISDDPVLTSSWSPNPGTPVRVDTSLVSFRPPGPSGMTSFGTLRGASGEATMVCPVSWQDEFTGPPTFLTVTAARRHPAST